MIEYAGIRDRHRRELEKRRTRAYARIPELQQLEDRTPSLAVDLLRKRLAQDPQDPAAPLSFRETADRISRRRTELLTRHGFPADYLEMTWDCPDCHDTGYIGREKCHCLRRRETAVLYDQSNLDTLAAGAGFASLSEEYYTESEVDTKFNEFGVEHPRPYVLDEKLIFADQAGVSVADEKIIVNY